MMSNRAPLRVSDNEDDDSDAESSSSITSDSTSRTTPADSWFDVKSDTEQRQQTNESNRIGTNDSNGATRNEEPLLLKSKSSENLPDTPSSVGDRDGVLSPTSSVSQAGRPWVNPYWDTDSKPRTNETHNEAAARSSPSFSSKKQLIPGSILIDDQGEIDGSTWKGRDTRLTSLASNNSFNPGGVYVSDESGGQGGFLAPTHTSASSAIPSSTLTARSKDDLDLKQPAPELDVSRQNFSNLSGRNDSTNDNAQEKKPWINPYWTTAVASDKDAGPQKKILSTSSTPTRAISEEASSRSRTPSPLQSERKSPSGADQTKSAWTNPYWDTKPYSKSPPTTLEPASATVSTTPWANPYWKDNKRQGVAALVDQKKVEDTSARQDTKSPVASSSQQNAKAWENPYWKENKSPTSGALASGNKVEDTTSREDTKSPEPSLSQQNAKAWENPYWKGNALPASSSSVKPDRSPSNSYVNVDALRIPVLSEKSSQQWDNSYPKENKSAALTSSKQPEKPWENPYLKDKTAQESETSKKSADADRKPQASTIPTQSSTPWKNPYWKEKSSASIGSTSQLTSRSTGSDPKESKPQIPAITTDSTKPWANPYWKDDAPAKSSAPKVADQPWENPYWKQKSSAPSELSEKPYSTLSTLQETTPWVNPYWKDNKSTSTEIKSNQISQNQSTNGNNRQKSSPASDSARTRANGNAADNNLNYGNRSPSQHSVPSIPSFYERVYPSSGPVLSSKRSSKTNLSPKPSQQISSQPTANDLPKRSDPVSNNQDALPFTIDNQGVLHYQAQSSSSPVSSFNAADFVTSSPRYQSQAAPSPPSVQSTFGTSKATPYAAGKPAAPSTSNTANLASVNILNALTSASSFVVITEQEISDIQKALRLLETNPNSVPTVEASQFAPKTTSNDRTQNRPYATLNTTQTPPSNPANYNSLSGSVNTSSSNYSSTVNNILDYPTKPKSIAHI